LLTIFLKAIRSLEGRGWKLVLRRLGIKAKEKSFLGLFVLELTHLIRVVGESLIVRISIVGTVHLRASKATKKMALVLLRFDL
jgi:hypothetical protein